METIWTDQTRFETILEVELLAAEAMSRRGKIDARVIRHLRQKAHVDIWRIRKIEKRVKHDIIAFLTHLEERIGPEARVLHAGLTSSDVLDTALAVQLVRSTDVLDRGLKTLSDIVKKLAKEHKHTPMAGRTHGVHAEPITFGLKVAGWYSELQRNRERLAVTRREVSYGKISGAVGTFAHADMSIEEEVCRRLGLKPEPLSTQIVPRDRHAHYIQTLALVASGLERIALEIRHLQRTEVLELEEPFTEGQKGSSAMPHKRNPVACENVCGLSRLIRSHVSAALENVPLWHERDISHSSVERIILPDASMALDFMIHRLIDVLSGLKVFSRHMKRNLDSTFELVCSQRILLALNRAGIDRQKAYEMVQYHAMDAWNHGKSFRTLIGADPAIRRHLSAAQIDRSFDLKPFLASVDKIFRRVFGKSA